MLPVARLDPSSFLLHLDRIADVAMKESGTRVRARGVSEWRTDKMKIELLWFEDCPCHQLAEDLVRGVLDGMDLKDVAIKRVEVSDEARGKETEFPGSPTVRVDGKDVQPGWEACRECTPRCRLYQSELRIGCLPEREWVVSAVREAVG